MNGSISYTDDATGFTTFTYDDGRSPIRVPTESSMEQRAQIDSMRSQYDQPAMSPQGEAAVDMQTAENVQRAMPGPGLGPQDFTPGEQAIMAPDMDPDAYMGPGQPHAPGLAPGMIGGAQTPIQQAGVMPQQDPGMQPGMQQPGMVPQEQPLSPRERAAMTYDVEAGVVAQGRDEREPMYREQEQLMGRQAQELDWMAAQRDQERMEAHNYMVQKRGELDNAQARLDQLVGEGVNPNRIFENGTVSRTQAVLAGILGGAIQHTTGGENKGVALLNKMVDRDMDAQKQTIAASQGQANNLLSTYAQTFGDFQAAETAFRLTETNYQIKELEQMAARIDNQGAREQANRTIADLLRQKAMLENKFDEANAKAAWERQKWEYEQRQKAARGRGGGGGRGGASKKDVAAQWKVEQPQQEALLYVDDLIAELDRLETVYGKDLPGVGVMAGLVPEMVHQGAVAMGSQESLDAVNLRNMIAELAVMGTQGKMKGTLTENDWKRLQASMPKQGDDEKVLRMKLNRMRALIKKGMGLERARDPEAAQELAGQRQQEVGPNMRLE